MDIDAKNGETACLSDPNGSGKSTLMKRIYGFSDVFRGSVAFRGTDVTNRCPRESLATGMGFASGESKFTGTGTELLNDDEVGRLYLGG